MKERGGGSEGARRRGRKLRSEKEREEGREGGRE